jgi:hypothetical protein
VTRVFLIAAVLLAPVYAQDSWDTVPKPGDADPFRPDEKAAKMPRSRDGKPDLSGIWQEHTLADWNVVKHRGDYGMPGGPGIAEADQIPYQDAALKKRNELAKSLYNDPQSNPATHCQLPGVPRITYMPFAFEIVQTPGKIDAIYEYAHAWRVFHLDRTSHLTKTETFDGDSIARWEGDTLVVDVKGFNDKTWLDMAGDFHSDQLHVVERYTPVDANTIWYEATIEDPKVYTRAWKLRLPLHRQAKNFELMEYECNEGADSGSGASGKLSSRTQ